MIHIHEQRQAAHVKEHGYDGANRAYLFHNPSLLVPSKILGGVDAQLGVIKEIPNTQIASSMNKFSKFFCLMIMVLYGFS